MQKEKIDKNALKTVTKETMELCKTKEIMLPSSYRVLFSYIAKKNKIDIGAESMYTREELNDKFYRQIESFDDNTGQAIEAIQMRDDQKLKIILENTQKLKKEIEALKRIAYEDGLTKALNRRWLEENYLDMDTETFKKNGVLALIDLNDFKIINDTMGHAVGDKILIHLVSVFKKFDTHVVRYGGDEFLLLFDNNSEVEVKDIVNITRELQLKKTYNVFNHHVKIKFGYAIRPFRIEESFSDVITEADKLLYEDKQKLKERIA